MTRRMIAFNCGGYIYLYGYMWLYIYGYMWLYCGYMWLYVVICGYVELVRWGYNRL